MPAHIKASLLGAVADAAGERRPAGARHLAGHLPVRAPRRRRAAAADRHGVRRDLTALLVGIGGVVRRARRATGSAGRPSHTDALIWSTVGINIIGSFLLGLLAAENWFSRDVREALGVGFLGGFTTFSTFSVQVVLDVDAGRAVAGLRLSASASVVGGLAAAALRVRPGAPSWPRRQSVRVCEHVFVRWDNLKVDARTAHAPARLPRPAAVRTLRRARGPGHPLLRGPGEVGAEPGAEGVADAVPLDDQPVSRMHHACAVLPGGRHADPDGRRAARSRSPICGSATRSTGPSGGASIAATCTPRCSRTGRRVKPAYRITLEDGTELVASGDHRFLTRPRLEARHRRASRARPAAAPHARTTS